MDRFDKEMFRFWQKVEDNFSWYRLAIAEYLEELKKEGKKYLIMALNSLQVQASESLILCE